ncbi:hypothetical protein BGLA2_2350009 [Burkholderia gladioli]|nr:hypothetical protein BGLA2_2350009 [Burkholderia gladioli]
MPASKPNPPQPVNLEIRHAAESAAPRPVAAAALAPARQHRLGAELHLDAIRRARARQLHDPERRMGPGQQPRRLAAGLHRQRRRQQLVVDLVVGHRQRRDQVLPEHLSRLADGRLVARRGRLSGPGVEPGAAAHPGQLQHERQQPVRRGLRPVLLALDQPRLALGRDDGLARLLGQPAGRQPGGLRRDAGRHGRQLGRLPGQQRLAGVELRAHRADQQLQRQPPALHLLPRLHRGLAEPELVHAEHPVRRRGDPEQRRQRLGERQQLQRLGTLGLALFTKPTNLSFSFHNPCPKTGIRIEFSNDRHNMRRRRLRAAVRQPNGPGPRRRSALSMPS